MEANLLVRIFLLLGKKIRLVLILEKRNEGKKRREHKIVNERA